LRAKRSTLGFKEINNFEIAASQKTLLAMTKPTFFNSLLMKKNIAAHTTKIAKKRRKQVREGWQAPDMNVCQMRQRAAACHLNYIVLKFHLTGIEKTLKL